MLGQKAMNSILLGLTKLHIRSINGKFVRTQTMKPPSSAEQEVIIFSGAKTTFLGQCTPFRTIIIHESVFENERLFDYVLIHEMAHRKQWWSFFGVPLLFLLIFGFFCLASAFIFLLQSLILMNPSYLLGFAWSVLLCLPALIIPCAFSWALEMHADFVAIKNTGLKAFEEVRDDLSKTRKLTLGSRIINRLTHPPAGFTVRVWRWFHK
jgi:hypothetical protein